MNQQRKIAAVVVNENGAILPYTTEGTKERCEEEAEKFYGKETWERMKKFGCQVKQCEIVLLE